MKRFITLLIFTLVISVNINAEAILVAPADIFDFGDIPSGSVLYNGFWVKSIGTDTVIIDEIKTGCSCAVTSKKTDRIPPGDSLLIDLEWDVSKNRSSISRSIRIFYNGKPDPIRLSLTGRIKQTFNNIIPVLIEPFRFEFGQTARKDIDSIQFTFTNTYPLDYEIKVISTISDRYTIDYPKSIKANESASGYIKLNEKYKDIPWQASITFSINDKDNTNMTIPVRRKFYK
ncbi:MAG: DUF1573 domain-containing protein [bacterium]